MFRLTVLVSVFVAISACTTPWGPFRSRTATVTVEPGRWWYKSYPVSAPQTASAKFSVQGGAVSAYFLSADEFARFQAGANPSTLRILGSVVNAATGQLGATVHAGTYVLAIYNVSPGRVTVTVTGTLNPVSK